MNKYVQIGQRLWEKVDDGAIAELEACESERERFWLWCGFMASAAGALTGDLGQAGARSVLTSALDLVEVAGETTP